ncbi:MAG: hypothetical protein R2824_32955 [Saprospiraceae bacterium]|nr:hypothetical protein [Lewinella sp.]
MKISHLMLIAGGLIFTACQSGDDLFEIMPGSDIAAIEGMHDAYEEARFYNESLERCFNASTPCDLEIVDFYDHQFHRYDEMFDHQHNQYSHNNIGDDHHHENGNMIDHGMMNGPQGHLHTAEAHEYQHNLATFQDMMDLRTMHELVHPK